MNDLKNRYHTLFTPRGLTTDQIKAIENRLDVKFSNELVEILKFYDGYFDLAKLSLYSFIIEGNTWNVCDQTEHYRSTIDLPKEYIVLKDGDESFIVLKTNDWVAMASPVFWIGVSDVKNLIEGKQLEDRPLIFPTFPDFFKFLLDEEEKMRAEEE